MIERLDYASVGLISGLEVHQQLLTREKLFCRCPGGLYVDTHDGEVLRHMRPTLSELGVYDGTALMEFKTKKEIVYLLNQLNVCTYEMDDTPPFLVNQDAIDVAMQLSLSMHMDIIDEVHIARKQYLDGSIPTGFQRTAIIGVNGWIPFKDRRLTVTHLSLEEDSCREVEDKGHRIIFRTDRLGMPLTETVTGAELHTPEEVRDAVRLCSLIARSTGRVRTGIGAGRQDINVSVRGGRRVEIKGVARAGYAVKLVHNEGIRQVNLLFLRTELHRRGLKTPADIRVQTLDATQLFDSIELDFLRKTAQEGGCVMAVKVEGVAGLAEHPTQPNTVFLDELAGRIRVIACLDAAPIVLGGGSLPQSPSLRRVDQRLRRKLQVGAKDDYFLVWGPKADCITAANEIRLRFADATEGVPNETRQSLPGGFTTFERILPGPDRMYPDTDSPPTRITAERVAAIRAAQRATPWERMKRFSEWNVPIETAEYLIRRGKAELVDYVVEKTGADGLIAAVEIGQRGKAMQRAGVPVECLTADHWAQVFDLFTDGRIPREGIREVAATLALNPEVNAKQAAENCGFNLQQPLEWERTLQTLTMDGYYQVNDSAKKRLRFLTGKATRMLHGKAPAEEVAALLQSQIQEVIL